jgi:hypothetical protein
VKFVDLELELYYISLKSTSMKATTTLLVFLTLHTFELRAQINSTNLDRNNVSAYISDVGTYFFDYSNSSMGYEVPKGSGIYAIYSTQFWFAGKDNLGEIHFVQGGTPSQGTDLFNGPISGPGSYDTQQYLDQWESSMWEICQSEIVTYLLWWECSMGFLTPEECQNVASPSMEIMNKMYAWPAHGDVTQGQAYFLAPFYDNPLGQSGSDGVYKPEDGDYPLIKGCCATYMIQNDAAHSHTYTNTDSLGIEIHTMFYQYETSDYLNDVTFVDITAINRSTNDYTEFSHSIVVDADLGNYSDDYYGCDSLSNCMFFYNGDNNDENNTFYLGYGINPPAIGVVSLEKEMTSCVAYNSGATTNAKWNLMHGLDANGNPWVDPNLNTTNFVYSGNPNVPAEWSAYSTGAQTGDALGISSHNYGAFNSGDIVKQSYAIVYARNGNHLENVQDVIDLSHEVKFFYDSNASAFCNNSGLGIDEDGLNELLVYPNPSNGIVYIKTEQNSDASINVFDVTGKIIYERYFSNTELFELNLTNQSKGIYTVQVQLDRGVFTKKLVID